MLTEEFEVVSVLGRGSYGQVYKAVHRQNGTVCAVKILPTQGQDNFDKISKEIGIMADCSCKNIVKCFGSEVNEHGICIFLEYCAGGSVKDIMKATGLQLSEEHIASILHATLMGLDYLHQRKTIHRDIKAGNILINEVGDIKLSDFGVSAELMHTLADKDTLIGSPFWMSPEVLSKSKYNCKTDIWSLGITAIELAEGQPPYSHIHPIRAMFAIQNNPPRGLSQPERWSPEFNDFVRKCLSYDPINRPTARELMADSFIRKSKGQFILQNLVRHSSQGLQKHRKQLKSTTTQSTVSNGNGTMIEHHGKVESYEPFWEGDQEQQEQNEGTMVVKAVEQPKQADFLLYYKEKNKNDRPSLQEKRPAKQNEEIKTAEQAKRALEALTIQMNAQIEQIKNKYKPQIDNLNNIISKKKQKKQEGIKMRTTESQPAKAPTIKAQPYLKKAKAQESQTFEQALRQVKESKRLNQQDDGSYFTSFLKKMKKGAQKENQNEELFNKSAKIEFHKIQKQQKVFHRK